MELLPILLLAHQVPPVPLQLLLRPLEPQLLVAHKHSHSRPTLGRRWLALLPPKMLRLAVLAPHPVVRMPVGSIVRIAGSTVAVGSSTGCTPHIGRKSTSEQLQLKRGLLMLRQRLPKRGQNLYQALQTMEVQGWMVVREVPTLKGEVVGVLVAMEGSPEAPHHEVVVAGSAGYIRNCGETGAVGCRAGAADDVAGGGKAGGSLYPGSDDPDRSVCCDSLPCPSRCRNSPTHTQYR